MSVTLKCQKCSSTVAASSKDVGKHSHCVRSVRGRVWGRFSAPVAPTGPQHEIISEGGGGVWASYLTYQMTSCGGRMVRTAPSLVPALFGQ